MMNIVFSDSVAGAMRLVTDPDTGTYFKSSDIFSFVWMLDIGSLQEGIDSRYRKELPGNMIMYESFFCSDEPGIPEIGIRNTRHWTTLKQRLQKKEPVRIWYGDDPESLCGMIFLCTLLKDYDVPVYAMTAPKVSTHGEERILSHGWGCFELEEMEEMLSRQRLMDRQEILAYAEHWEKLARENAPLRAVISGIPTSVGADFYDWFLEQCLPSNAIEESKVIGDTLCRYIPDVNVSYLVMRVQNMIDSGKIAVLKTPDDHPMHRNIKRIKNDKAGV